MADAAEDGEGLKVQDFSVLSALITVVFPCVAAVAIGNERPLDPIAIGYCVIHHAWGLMFYCCLTVPFTWEWPSSSLCGPGYDLPCSVRLLARQRERSRCSDIMGDPHLILSISAVMMQSICQCEHKRRNDLCRYTQGPGGGSDPAKMYRELPGKIPSGRKKRVAAYNSPVFISLPKLLHPTFTWLSMKGPWLASAGRNHRPELCAVVKGNHRLPEVIALHEGAKGNASRWIPINMVS